MNAISCPAPYGGGGLGQILAQVVETKRSDNALGCYYATAIKPGDPAGVAVDMSFVQAVLQHSPLRYDAGWRNYISGSAFDRAVARRLRPGETMTGFVGQSLSSFTQARRLGYSVLELEAANSHVDNVIRQHEKAARMCNLRERSWMNETQARKIRREYEMADVVHADSDYTVRTLIDGGVPENKIVRRRLDVASRFVPPARRPDDGIFRVVYVGSISVMKGIPILMEAFERLPIREAKLTLVGGWASRVMRVYMEERLARDSRIHVSPGDPLAHLQQANVCVHPTFEDGFAYAPMEAMACGVPVIVTEDTGMKEYVREDIDGYIVPTGDIGRLLERMMHVATTRRMVVAAA